MKKNYQDFFGFDGIYLEDSFVLEIVEKPSEIVFKVEFVILENHPRFTKPIQGESYCFINGTLVFTNVQKAVWKRRTFNKFRDANQEVDFGNIDVLFELKGKYHIEGDWGEVMITADTPSVIFA
jgi:hypothetical protein